ncbi:serine hydrolase domain-containing protein [Flavitalea flava]
MKLLSIILFLITGVSSIAQTQLSQKLDSLFREQLENGPGIALRIEKRGEILYQKTTGLANDSLGSRIDSTTNFRMASLSKQFTAMGILLLEKEHRLSFKDPIQKYFPELPARIGQKILIRHLLTHSSGLMDYESLIPASQSKQVLDADVLALLTSQDSLYFSPGNQFRYSNSGYCLLALIIERISHQSFSTFIKEKIFIPLGMNNSVIYEEGLPIRNRAMGYARDSPGRIIFSDQSITSATKGDGGVYTSLIDYGKWLRALQQNKLVRLPEVLRGLRFRTSAKENYFYAAGWFIIASQPVTLFHSGSTCGFANFVIQLPGDEWSIVYFSNLAENTTPFHKIIQVLKDTGNEDFTQVFLLHDLTR